MARSTRAVPFASFGPTESKNASETNFSRLCRNSRLVTHRRATGADFIKADTDLNATYRKALELATKQDFSQDDGLIRPEGIREAERAWLKYRDAWVAFATLHYQQTDSNAWLTLLTRNRYWSLRATLCEVGWTDPACKNSVKSED
jgi:uncharacterized protein YecT (DUF1311 family)